MQVQQPVKQAATSEPLSRLNLTSGDVTWISPFWYQVMAIVPASQQGCY